MISTAIYTMLYADSKVKGKVSTRIYPNRAVQDAAMPYLVYSQVTKLPADSKDSGTGFDKYRIQVDVVDDSYTACELLAYDVRAAMDRVTGTFDTLIVLQTVYVDENESPQLDDEGSTKVYMRSVDFMIIAK